MDSCKSAPADILWRTDAAVAQTAAPPSASCYNTTKQEVVLSESRDQSGRVARYFIEFRKDTVPLQSTSAKGADVTKPGQKIRCTIRRAKGCGPPHSQRPAFDLIPVVQLTVGM